MTALHHPKRVWTTKLQIYYSILYSMMCSSAITQLSFLAILCDLKLDFNLLRIHGSPVYTSLKTCSLAEISMQHLHYSHNGRRSGAGVDTRKEFRIKAEK